MRRALAAGAGMLLAGLSSLIVLVALLTVQPVQIEAEPTGGPYEDILPAFQPGGDEEFYFEIWNGWSFTVTGYITVHTGISIHAASMVGAIPIELPALATTTIPISEIPGVPVGLEGFAQVWTDRIVDSNAYSSEGNHHIIVLEQMSFGAPPIAAAARAKAGHTLPAGSAPYSITIEAGDTVSWVNSHWVGFNHNVRADDDSFSSGEPNMEWRVFHHTFAASGSYAFYCANHGGPGGVGMAGVINVSGDSQEMSYIFLPMIRQEGD